MKRAFFRLCITWFVSFCVLNVSAAQAQIDSKLVGFWLCKKAPGPDWSLWHIGADGKSTIQFIGGQENSLVLQSDGALIKKQDSKDDRDDVSFAIKADDEIAIASNGALGLLLRLPEERWKVIHLAESAESFPEYADSRFAILDDKPKVRALLCNLDPRMRGSWICESADGKGGIWSFADGGAVAFKSFGEPNEIAGWIMRSGSSFVIGGDVPGSSAYILKYSIVSPDEMILADDHGKKVVLMRIASDRGDELYNMQPPALAATPEYAKLNQEVKRQAQQ